ncbi:Serine/threonine protein kinase OS=Streptomyces alboniger OX=132473 GN=CP975_17630 PE=4 SV=1 [Streptomyces alboniger]
MKWAVSALLIAALGLGSWQLADALMDQGKKSDDTGNTQTTDGDDKNSTAPKPVKTLSIERASEFVAKGDAQHPSDVDKTYDGNSSTYWKTSTFLQGPPLEPYKPGVGIVYDLGSAQELSSAGIGLRYSGNHTTAKLYASDSLTPSSLDSMKQIGSVTTNGTTATVKVAKPVKTQYVLVWLTAVPYSDADPSTYSDPGYKQAITEVKFTG